MNMLTEKLITGTGFVAEDISVVPHKVNLFGFIVSETVITAWVVMLIIILFAVVVRVFLLKKFETIPKGLQNILEIIVEFFERFSNSIIGKHGRCVCSIYIYCSYYDILHRSGRTFWIQGACDRP